MVIAAFHQSAHAVELASAAQSRPDVLTVAAEGEIEHARGLAELPMQLALRQTGPSLALLLASAGRITDPLRLCVNHD